MRLSSNALPISMICSALLLARPALADDSAAASHEAGKHFQRAVSLYGEADYRAALVEFKRAYAASPHTSVLYNIGETQFQLQDYAAALTTFERYLAESGPTDAHRAEVESNVEILKARVGHVTVTTIPAGADITVDDQPVGRSPLDPPLLVSIGHRKIIATIAGRPPVTKYVDVATDDNLSITLQLADGASQAPAADPSFHAWNPTPDQAPQQASHSGSTWRAIGWTMTGVLAAGGVTMGLLAIKASNDLAAQRNVYPASASTLNHDSNLTSTYSIIADSLAIGAIVVGSITLVSSISSSSEPTSSGTARLSLSPASARLDVTF